MTSEFLSYYPLKQGLKLEYNPFPIVALKIFLSYYPLKQGLKPKPSTAIIFFSCIFILLSIKTRIETTRRRIEFERIIQFLSYYPLKQGLKLAK